MQDVSKQTVGDQVPSSCWRWCFRTQGQTSQRFLWELAAQCKTQGRAWDARSQHPSMIVGFQQMTLLACCTGKMSFHLHNRNLMISQRCKHFLCFTEQDHIWYQPMLFWQKWKPKRLQITHYVNVPLEQSSTIQKQTKISLHKAKQWKIIVRLLSHVNIC